jgi:hypothetical protein
MFTDLFDDGELFLVAVDSDDERWFDIPDPSRDPRAPGRRLPVFLDEDLDPWE